MPFDNAGMVITPPHTLADLKLTPISEDRAKSWRDAVTNKFISRDLFHARLVYRGMARWEKSRTTPAAFASNYRSAPADVKRLARSIGVIPGARLAVQWFDKDPILYAYIPNNQGRMDEFCLAIWDKGVVRAIADGARLSPTQRLLRRFVQTA